MNINTAENILWMALGIFIGMAIVVVVYLNTTEHHKEIVKHECAVYDSQTGDFKWLQKEKDETNNSNK